MAEKSGIVDAYGNPVSLQTQGSQQFSNLNLAGFGGIVNPATGLGGPSDKTSSAHFRPTLLRTRMQVDPIYLESWIARKFINMPVDDMFFRGRRWTGNDESAIKAMEDAWTALRLARWLPAAMKNGRLYGTGFLALMVEGQDTDRELDPATIGEGKVKAVHSWDRFDMNITEWKRNMYDPGYGEAAMYHASTRYGHLFDIHPTRMLRFDGVAPLRNDGWTWYYDRNWGVSELISALVEIIHDSSFSAAVAHMSQEASIPVVKMQGFQNALTGKPGPREATPEQVGSAINLYKSIFKTMFIGESDEFDRVGISFAGIAQLFDKYSLRVAAMAGIPATRFLSRAPDGMDATGDSDMKNYAIHVGSMQRLMLAEPLKFLDMAIARHVGLAAPPEYEWQPLMDLSESERYENAKALAEALAAAQPVAQLDENEVRERLSTNEVFGELDELAEDEMGTREEVDRLLEEQRMLRRAGPAAAPAGNNG